MTEQREDARQHIVGFVQLRRLTSATAIDLMSPETQGRRVAIIDRSGSLVPGATYQIAAWVITQAGRLCALMVDGWLADSAWCCDGPAEVEGNTWMVINPTGGR